jgi:hypothetical protein
MAGLSSTVHSRRRQYHHLLILGTMLFMHRLPDAIELTVRSTTPSLMDGADMLAAAELHR